MMRARILFVLLSLIACRGRGVAIGTPCETDESCGVGLSCYSGVCLAPCLRGACGVSEQCNLDGFCVKMQAQNAGCDPACAAGQECVRGTCSCTPKSCPRGCCTQGVCVQPNDTDHCGYEGTLCRACSGLTPSCADGQCRADCAATLSCGSGCCTADDCQTGFAPEACGTSGACVDCRQSGRGNLCLNGVCGCATSDDCAPQEACNPFSKTCSRACTGGETCRDGCCSDGLCVATGALCASGEACRASGRCGCRDSSACDDYACAVKICGSDDTCQYPPAPAVTVCRDAAGSCDGAESCDGTNTACPPDTFIAAGTVCRAAEDICDQTEKCTGAAAACPPDAAALSAGALCRAALPSSSAGAISCDVAESCTLIGGKLRCPEDGFLPATVECRASAGVCDYADYCSGSDASCGSRFVEPSAQCSVDPIQYCSGTDVLCFPSGCPFGYLPGPGIDDCQPGPGAPCSGTCPSPLTCASSVCVGTLTPALTGPPSPPAAILASPGDNEVGRPSWYMFDSSLGSSWISDQSAVAPPVIAGYSWGDGVSRTVVRYRVAWADCCEERGPLEWTLQGSNDGSLWTTVDTRSGQTGWSGMAQRWFDLAAPATYLMFRLAIGDDNYTPAGSIVMISISDFTLQGY